MKISLAMSDLVSMPLMKAITSRPVIRSTAPAELVLRRVLEEHAHVAQALVLIQRAEPALGASKRAPQKASDRIRADVMAVCAGGPAPELLGVDAIIASLISASCATSAAPFGSGTPVQSAWTPFGSLGRWPAASRGRDAGFVARAPVPRRERRLRAQ